MLAQIAELGVAAVSAEITRRARQYWRGLGALATLALIFPILIAIPGIYWQEQVWWLKPLAGCWAAFWGLLLFGYGAALGILIETLMKGVKKLGVGGMVWYSIKSLFGKSPESLISGEMYLKLVRGFLMWEILMYWVVSVLPIRNNPKFFPLLVLGGIGFGFMAWHYSWEGKVGEKTFKWGLLVTMLTSILLIVFPTLSETLSKDGIWSGVKAVWTWMDSGAWYRSKGVLALTIIGSISLFVYLKFFHKRTEGEHHSSAGGGGHGHGMGPVMTTFLACTGIFFLLTVIVMLVSPVVVAKEIIGQKAVPAVRTMVIDHEQDLDLPPHVWTTIDVGLKTVGVKIRDVDRKIWVDPGYKPAYLDWAGATNNLPGGIDRLKLKPEGDKSVKVTVTTN